MEQIVNPVPLVPLLHDAAPQMVEQLVDFLAPFGFRVAEQVIEVPKIVYPPRAARTVLRAPQTAEQSVDVQMEPACALAVIAVQAIGLSAATALAKQNVYNPVPQVRRGGGGGLQGFLPGQGSSSSSRLHENTDDGIQGVFRTFPRGKKCGVRSALRVGTECRL